MRIGHLLFYFTCSVFLISGCDRGLQFSSRDLASPGAPGVECVLTDADLEVPSAVEQDQNFQLKFPRDNVTWSLKLGTQELHFSGPLVSTSLHEKGLYLGQAKGINNCGKEVQEDFQIQVLEKVQAVSISINSNDLYTRSQDVQLDIVAIGAEKMFVTNDPTCQSGSWIPYSTTKTWTLGESNKATQVYVKFKNLIRETPCISDSIIHDNVPPHVWFVSSPSGFINQTVATLEFGAEDQTSGVKDFFCKLDQESYKICPLAVNFSNLDEGNHTVSIYADDKAGNTSPEESISFVVDTKAPTVKITEKPDSLSNSKNALFKFEGEDDGTPINTFECSIDNSKFSSCTTPKNYVALGEGAHSFKVKGIDRAGNASSPAEYSWSIDSIAPAIQFTKTPDLLTPKTDALFEFNIVENGSGLASVKCQLDNNSPTGCLTSAVFNNLPNAVHTFKVVAKDKAGNTGTKAYTWEVNDKITDQEIPITDTFGKSDILFVVQNSSDMFTTLRESIPYRFKNFVDKLGALDYQISVVTADASGTRATEGGNIVPILRTPVPGPGIALVPKQYLIHPNMSEPSTYTLATIMRPEAICVQTGTHLCPHTASGYQEGIHSTIKAINNSFSQLAFRDDASLDLVIISKTDEANGNYSNGSDISNNLPTENQPETLINLVESKWPGKRFRAHSIIYRPSDRYCNGMYVRDARKAPIYNKLSTLTGGNTSSICNDLNRSEIENIASTIGGAPSSFKLKCAPVNGVVQATFNPQPLQQIQTIVQGNTIRFVPMPPAGTTVHLRYTCP